MSIAHPCRCVHAQESPLEARSAAYRRVRWWQHVRGLYRSSWLHVLLTAPMLPRLVARIEHLSVLIFVPPLWLRCELSSLVWLREWRLPSAPLSCSASSLWFPHSWGRDYLSLWYVMILAPMLLDLLAHDWVVRVCLLLLHAILLYPCWLACRTWSSSLSSCLNYPLSRRCDLWSL